MTSKEVERDLSVSRDNIRYYEQEGLLDAYETTHRSGEYSEEWCQALKRIVFLRKLGFDVETIKRMQSGVLSLGDAAGVQIARLETEEECPTGALHLTKKIATEGLDFKDISRDDVWALLAEAEARQESFVEIDTEDVPFALRQMDAMWKRVFFYDFRRSRVKHGLPIAILIVLLICVVRGLSSQFLWQGSFWEGFLYPLALFLVVSAILFPIYLLSRRAPRAAAVISRVLSVICGIFLVGVLLLLLVLLLNAVFHFWF